MMRMRTVSLLLSLRNVTQRELYRHLLFKLRSPPVLIIFFFFFFLMFHGGWQPA